MVVVFGTCASFAANVFHSESSALPKKFDASEIAPAGKIITAPPFLRCFFASALVFKLLSNAASVSSKSMGKILSITAGACRSTLWVMIL